MEKILKSRGMSIKEPLRELAEEKLGTLEKFDPNLTECEVEFISEKNPQRGDESFKVHFRAHSKHGVQRIEAVGGNPEAAFYDGFDRLRRVIRKQREKATEHR